MSTVSTPAADLEHTIEPGGSVSIETLETEVRLRAVDGRAVRVRLADGDLAAEFRIETTDTQVRIRPARRWTFGLHRVRGPLDVEVPRDAHVEVETASGSVLGLDLTAGLGVRTASGDIELAGVGGDVRATSVSGTTRIQAAGVTRLGLGSVSGRIDVVAAAAGTVKARSTSGAIRLMGGFRGDGPFSLETVSGGLTLGTDEPIRLMASTISGDVRSEIDGADVARGDGRRTIALLANGPEVSVRTISGGIRLVAWTPPVADASPRTEASTSPPTAASAGAAPASSIEEPALPISSPQEPASTGAPSESASSEAPSEPRPRAEAAESPPDIEAARLAILRALAHGEISVAEAERRIDALEDVPR